jgi:hypothetical protein
MNAATHQPAGYANPDPEFTIAAVTPTVWSSTMRLAWLEDRAQDALASAVESPVSLISEATTWPCPWRYAASTGSISATRPRAPRPSRYGLESAIPRCLTVIGDR